MLKTKRRIPKTSSPFIGELKKTIQRIQKAMYEVYPDPIEKWERDFACDLHPWREIAIWSHIAATYQEVTRRKSYSPEEKRDLFGLFLDCSMWPRDRILSQVKIKVLPLKTVKTLIRFYDKRRRAI